MINQFFNYVAMYEDVIEWVLTTYSEVLFGSF